MKELLGWGQILVRGIGRASAGVYTESICIGCSTHLSIFMASWNCQVVMIIHTKHAGGCKKCMHRQSKARMQPPHSRLRPACLHVRMQPHKHAWLLHRAPASPGCVCWVQMLPEQVAAPWQMMPVAAPAPTHAPPPYRPKWHPMPHHSLPHNPAHIPQPGVACMPPIKDSDASDEEEFRPDAKHGDVPIVPESESVPVGFVRTGGPLDRKARVQRCVAPPI